MDKYLPYLDRYGIAVALIAVAAYFFIKHWWPYWKDQDQADRAAKREQLDRMLDLQEGAMREMTVAIQANTRQSEKIADHMEALTEEVRRR